MMALDSALVILMAEALAVMVLLALAMFFWSRSKRGKELAEVDRFITQMADEVELKNRLLEEILVKNCGVDGKAAAVTLQEVGEAERALMQRVIQMFLQRDPALLSEIDQLIANLSDPYCKLMAGGDDVKAGAVSGGSVASGTGEVGNKKVAGLEHINQQLVRQLDTAMQTIDEITSEYTRVFSGNQTALELENSCKKMQQVFLDAEQRIKANLADLEA